MEAVKTRNNIYIRTGKKGVRDFTKTLYIIDSCMIRIIK